MTKAFRGLPIKSWILFTSLLFFVPGCGQKSEVGTAPGGNPEVVLFSPAAGTINFSKDHLDEPSPIWALFSKDMNSTSVRTNTVLSKGCGSIVDSSKAYDPQTRTVTVLAEELEPEQQYFVSITRSATDPLGVPLTSDVFWRFTTGDRLDTDYPYFDGLQTLDVNSSTELALGWNAAVDAKDLATPQDRLEYNIYQGVGPTPDTCTVILGRPFRALKSQADCQLLSQDPNTPECSYQVNGSQWSYQITGLTANTGYCYIVRARDLACHEEANRNKVHATTKVGGKLYVANLGNNDLAIYDNAGEAEKNTPRRIQSNHTQINFPIGTAFTRIPQPDSDPNDNIPPKIKKSLYVANFSSNAVLAYDWEDREGSFIPSGDVGPTRVLGGALSLIRQPTGLFADPNTNQDRLYLTNYNTHAIIVIDNASQVTDFTVPPKNFTIVSNPPGAVDYDDPVGIAVDTGRDILYVAYKKTKIDDLNIIGIVDGLSTKNGTLLNPTRFISRIGLEVDKTLLSNPAGLWLEPDQDRLYVANRGADGDNGNDDAILVFDNASSSATTGNIPPTWIIKKKEEASAPPLFNVPYMMYMVRYPITKHRLFVANSADGKILVFDDIDAELSDTKCPEEISGIPKPRICIPTPSLVLEGVKTQINIPRGVAVEHHDNDGSDTLYVANESSILNLLSTYSINVFENVLPPAPSSGPSAPALDRKPDRMISPSIHGPSGVMVNTESGTLYATNILSDSISVFVDINNTNLSGNLASTYQILGPNTGLEGPAGVALVPAAGSNRDRLFVANLFGNSVLEYDLLGLESSNLCSTPAGGSSPHCNLTPFSTSSYSETGVNLKSPFGISVDAGNSSDISDDILYVSYRDQDFSDNRGDSVIVFRRSGNGFVPTRRIISPSFPLVAPAGLYLDTYRDELYVANRSANTILVFDVSEPSFQAGCNTSTIRLCRLAPIRVISTPKGADPSLTLARPNWVFLDTFSTPNKLYVSNRGVTTRGESFILVYNDADTANGALLPFRSVGGLLVPTGIFLDPTK